MKTIQIEGLDLKTGDIFQLHTETYEVSEASPYLTIAQQIKPSKNQKLIALDETAIELFSVIWTSHET